MKRMPCCRPHWSKNLPVVQCWQLPIALQRSLIHQIVSWWWMLVDVWPSLLRRQIYLAIHLLCCQHWPTAARLAWPDKYFDHVLLSHLHDWDKTKIRLKIKTIFLWRSIQHNNTTPLIRMRFSVTSLLGQWGQICFSEFLKIISSFFARVDILLCSERKKTGGFSSKFGTLAPSK